MSTIEDKISMLGIDTMLMLDDLRDLLDFSEQNIQWQRKRELRRSERDWADKLRERPDIGLGDSESQRTSVERRFDNLLQRIRYASLIALITTIERVALTIKALAESMDRAIPPRPIGKNMVVHLLNVFSQFGIGSERRIIPLETLIQVRNCIVHAGGLVDEYEFAAQLRSKLTDFEGIRIVAHEFWGQDSIEIKDDYLQRLLDDAKEWNLEFYR